MKDSKFKNLVKEAYKIAKDSDKRTKHEKENLHYPCCINLVDNENMKTRMEK